ncbi:MlaD family protein [Flagellimonas allohymeniacidonis]|uniref:MCE family protein n=1 Tax=Flagellimonas allohymeniacidonis TaxID=2517819 RepID=A0A4Q8QDA6_9FLAO|nr:MlaD family protein [Allomuricauda hymeniacidonis]TAI48442.1 MCE family protein [Allomuricauda hymeniacidonis]
MAKTSAERVRLGLFVVLGTILITVGAYLIGNNQNLFSKNFSISAVFNNVNGLQLGNNVRFSGINVGTVKGIDMENDSTIRVRMFIEEKMQKHIKKDAIATIGSDGLVGSMIINIIPGKGSIDIVEDGDEIDSYSRIGAEDMLSTLNVTNQNAALLTADLLQITESLKNGKGTFGRLLNDTLMAHDLQEIVGNLKQTSIQTNAATKELNSLLASVGSEGTLMHFLLRDSIAGIKMKGIVQNLENSSVHLDTLLDNLNGLSKDLNSEEGALAYLTRDTSLVKQLERTIENIEQGTGRFNENMEALKHNFLTRRYFKKQAKEQKSNSN